MNYQKLNMAKLSIIQTISAANYAFFKVPYERYYISLLIYIMRETFNSGLPHSFFPVFSVFLIWLFPFSHRALRSPPSSPPFHILSARHLPPAGTPCRNDRYWRIRILPQFLRRCSCVLLEAVLLFEAAVPEYTAWAWFHICF